MPAMFTTTQFETLFAYHFHTTLRLLEHAEKLSDADYQAQPGYGHGSVHDLFFHLLRTLWGWRQGLETGHQPPPLPPETYPDLPALRQGFRQEQDAWQGLLAGLSAEEIEATVTLTTLRGDSMPFLRWRIFQHLVLHGMQHHTELAQLLTARGQSPGDIDFLFFR